MMNGRDKARRLLKYIFCVLILAALIFQSFCTFYLANTYRKSQKNSSIFPPDNGIFYANIATPEINELEPVPSSDYSEQSESPDSPEEPERPEIQDLPAEIPETETEAAVSESDIEIEDDAKTISDDEQIQEPDEEYSGQYTEEELLYSILETMKVNQYITTFILAIAAIIIVFKPITQSYIG